MLLIVNPTSASGATRQNIDNVRLELKRLGVECREYTTRKPGDATNAARSAFASGETRVIAVGGDGTLNEVAAGYFAPDGTPINPDGAVGLIPSGTGSDFRRTLGLSTTAEAAASIARDRVRAIDIAQATFSDQAGVEQRRTFVNAASFGFGGATVARVNSWRGVLPPWVGGQPRFVFAALGALWDYTNRPVRVVLDGNRTVEASSDLVVVSNGRYAGSGMKLAPLAEFDDGLLDVLIADGVTRAGIIRELTRVWDGTHIENTQIIMLRARKIEISAEPQMAIDLDGEAVGVTPAVITVRPSALPFIV